MKSRLATFLLRKYIFFRCLWTGGTTQEETAAIFGVTSSTLQRHFRDIVEMAEHHERVDIDLRIGKAFLEGSPEVSSRDAKRLFYLLSAQSHSEDALDTRGQQADEDLFGKPWFWELGFRDYTHLTTPPVDPNVLENLIKAVREKLPVSMRYHSKGQTSYLSFSPHIMVYIYGRHHIRGWHHEKKKIVDLVLARIEECSVVDDGAYIGPGASDYSKVVELQFQMNPDLPEPLRRSLAMEWREAMVDGVLTITCHEHVAIYIIREMERPDSDGLQRWIKVEQDVESS